MRYVLILPRMSVLGQLLSRIPTRGKLCTFSYVEAREVMGFQLMPPRALVKGYEGLGSIVEQMASPFWEQGETRRLPVPH